MNIGNYKGFCFYFVIICGVIIYMYYKCQSNFGFYMCIYFNVDMKGFVCVEEYEI